MKFKKSEDTLVTGRQMYQKRRKKNSGKDKPNKWDRGGQHRLIPSDSNVNDPMVERERERKET